MSQQISSQGGHLIFPISPKNSNFVEDVGILLPVKFLILNYMNGLFFEIVKDQMKL